MLRCSGGADLIWTLVIPWCLHRVGRGSFLERRVQNTNRDGSERTRSTTETKLNPGASVRARACVLVLLTPQEKILGHRARSCSLSSAYLYGVACEARCKAAGLWCSMLYGVSAECRHHCLLAASVVGATEEQSVQDIVKGTRVGQTRRNMVSEAKKWLGRT
jgi:hypothetical protein